MSMMVVAMVKLKAVVRALQMVEATEIAMAVVIRARAKWWAARRVKERAEADTVVLVVLVEASREMAPPVVGAPDWQTPRSQRGPTRSHSQSFAPL